MKKSKTISTIIAFCITAIYALIYLQIGQLPRKILFSEGNFLASLHVIIQFLLYFYLIWMLAYCFIKICEKLNKELKDIVWNTSISYSNFHILAGLFMAVISIASLIYLKALTAIIVVDLSSLIFSFFSFLGLYGKKRNDELLTGSCRQPTASLLLGSINSMIAGFIGFIIFNPLAGALIWLLLQISTLLFYLPSKMVVNKLKLGTKN